MTNERVYNSPENAPAEKMEIINQIININNLSLSGRT